MRQLFAEGGHVGGVVEVLGVALVGGGERGLGEFCFEGQHCVGVFCGLGVGLAGKDEHLVDVVDVLLALLRGFGVGAGVVVALGQAEAASAVEADDLAGVGEV